MDRRKTQENVKEKVAAQPSKRISRLAQPRKYSATPHSLNRNRSSSHENVALYNRQIPKRSRSNSAAPHLSSETPVRPPMARSLSSLFTPASTNKNTASTNRANRHDNEQIARILAVSRNHFGPTFLPGGLQSMSAKQFTEIVGFFAQKISGKVVIRDSNVDDVKLFVDFMEYPHQMNKSWFKAPTVSIAFDRNVEFLDWLCDFVVTDDGDAISIDIEYKDTEPESPVDQQFASFVGDLREGFVIWSSETVEFDEWKLKWIREMIHTRTGLDDIDTSTGRIQNDYAILEAKEAPFDNEHLLQAQLRKLEELKKEVANLKVICQKKSVEVRELSEELQVLASTNAQHKKTEKEMKETIKNQRMSASDRQNYIADLNHKKFLRDKKQDFINTLQTINDENQIQIARLRSQKTNKIQATNALVQKMFQVGIQFGNLTVDQLSIKESDTEAEIQSKLQQFTQIREIINAHRADIRASVNETQSQLTSITHELFVKENEISTLKKQLHSLEVRAQKVENEMTDTQYQSQLQQQQLQTTLDMMAEEIGQIQQKIVNQQMGIEVLKAENKAIYEGIEIRSDAILKAKLERQAQQEAAVAALEEVAEELKDAVNNLVMQ